MLIDQSWWQSLEPQWQQAFGHVFFQHANEPTSDELAHLYAAPAIRFAGPTAFFPNMSFELSNLSGIAALTQLETLVVINHQVQSIKEVASLKGLKHLFLLDNKITSLDGIQDLKELEMLYVQHNLIEDLSYVKQLVKLKDLYVHDNRIASFDGITEQHGDELVNFYCSPNELLKQKDLLKIEREYGIRCKTA